MDQSQREASLTYSGRLSALPDDVLCHMLSFLTLCDSVSTRLLSSRWRYLSDNRSVLQFDPQNVLRRSKNEMIAVYMDRSLARDKFVKGVDKFLEKWEDRKLCTLKVDFYLNNNQSSHIDSWVERGIRMKIETLEVHLIRSEECYVLCDQLFHYGKAFYLKHLRLRQCDLTFSSDCISWISHLATLELVLVPLRQEDIECVMSGGLNLTSLRLHPCRNQVAFAINVKLPHLKELIIGGNFRLIELNCSNLESFKLSNLLVDCCKFSHLPLLKKVTLPAPSESNCSFMFDKLARHVPNLQALAITQNLKVHIEPLPSNSTMSRLTWLSLCFDPPHFDVLSITYLLNASPFLEILHLEFRIPDFPEQKSRREYIDCPHLHLKEVKIQGFRAWDFIELGQYLLNNAVALERMVIKDACACSLASREMSSNKCFLRYSVMADDTSYCVEEIATSYCSSRREEVATTLLQNIQSNAELVFQSADRRVVLNASNRMGHGVDLVYLGS